MTDTEWPERTRTRNASSRRSGVNPASGVPEARVPHGSSPAAARRGREVRDVHRLRWRFAREDDLLVGLARHVEEECLVRFDR